MGEDHLVPESLRKLLSSIRSLGATIFHRSRIEADMDDELRTHLQHRADDLERSGLSRGEAERRAHIEFGGYEGSKEEIRRTLGTHFLETLIQDARFGLRVLRKSPGFTAVAVLTLALGIGANSAIFSVIDGVVLHPLPFPKPDQLIWLNGKFPGGDLAAVSAPDFIDYRAENHGFDHIFAMGFRGSPSNLSGDKPEQVLSTFATADFLHTLGIQPLLGRDFLPSDEQASTPQVAILGYGLWRRNFGADPDIIGHHITLDGSSLTVVGVLPHDLPLISAAEIWVPAPMLAPGMKMRLAHFLMVIGRLKSGVSLAQSQADLDSIAARLAQQYPDTDKGWSLRQRQLSEVLIGPVRPALLLMLAAVALLLLIACANVANLLLARCMARQREFIVRTALGARPGRVLRQTLTESMILALLGGAVGVFLALWGINLLRAVGPADLPRLAEVHINPAVLAFTVGISLLTGMIFGLIPAVEVSRLKSVTGLTDFGRASASGSRSRLGGFLMIGELAVSLTLLVGAGLLLNSFWRLIHVNPGFQTEHVMTAHISLGGPSYRDPQRRAAFWQEFERRVASLPGVQAVGATSEIPLGGEHSDCPFYMEGKSYGPSEFDDANCRQVTPGYLSTMGIPLRAGRRLVDHDTATAPGVMLVNQAFVARYFPNQEAIGKRLQVMEGHAVPRVIVGIVGNISQSALSDPQQPEMYVSYAQSSPPTMNLVVRTAAEPGTLPASLRDAISAVDKDVALSLVRSLDDVRNASVAQPRFSSQLVGLFAALALLLSAVGLYGLMAYSVSQRTKEIGIRMALGAARGNILRMTLARGLRLALWGTCLGLAGAFAFTRLLQGVLYGVSATDPLTYAAVSLLLTVVALLACYLPARRAMRTDPMVALRYE
ncbi:MAG TPA: ABC transporter permease [Candidatus Angelobacter sp.]